MKKIIFPILILVVVLCACAAKSPAVLPEEKPVSTEPVITEPVKQIYKASLYFASEDAMYLIPEEREIKYENEDELPLAVLKLLTDGPVSQNLYPVLNKETIFEAVSVKNGNATVTVADNFIALNSGGSTKEFMALYSVVNTLCEFNNIDSVRFADSNGNVMEEFGSYIIDLPLTKDTTMTE